MPVSDDFLLFVVERFSQAGYAVTFRRMFGGAMLYERELPFALIADDVLYFKADEATRIDFEAAGMERFRPFEGKAMSMNFYTLPDDALEDESLLAEWTGRALDAARRQRRPASKNWHKQKRPG